MYVGWNRAGGDGWSSSGFGDRDGTKAFEMFILSIVFVRQGLFTSEIYVSVGRDWNWMYNCCCCWENELSYRYIISNLGIFIDRKRKTHH